MAFSFNPTQAAQGGGGGLAPSVSQNGAPSFGGAVADAPSSVPDSPFLFLRNRDQEMTVNAYLQLLLILGATLFVAASVIVFAYSQYLSISISKKKAELAAMEVTFKTYPFDEMKALSNKLSALEGIMKTYVSSKSPLKYLEKVVENQVVFDDFSFINGSKGTTIAFSIITGSQRALIQQLDALNLREYSKTVPSTKMESFSDNETTFKARVGASVSVQGVLADEILFLAPTATSSVETKK